MINMFALVRLGIVLLIGLSIVYLCLSLYSRSRRKAKLREEWQETDQSGDWYSFKKEGLQKYDRSLRAKLIWGVYVVPIAVVTFLVYVTNFW